MSKKADLIGIIGLLLAIFTLVFGDNIYQQITERSVFQNPSSTNLPVSTLIAPSELPPEITDANGAQTLPTTYTTQPGEFPYCIARRLNVDPDELYALNGLSYGEIYYPNGMVLKIPQTGNPFPGTRSLRNHPTQYTVTTSNETIYGVACIFGDVLPEDIASLNDLSISNSLIEGQVLQIP
jgi:LysM repeat protein